MKRLLLSICICCMSLGLFSQIQIEILPTDLQYTLQADLSDEYSEPIAHSWVINKSNQAIKLRWLIEVPSTGCSSEWKYKICDKNACYASNVTSNVVVGGQPNVPVLLAPGDTTIIDLHINPRFVAGCCSPTIHFSEVTDANNQIDLGSATYEVCISNLSSVNEKQVLAIRAYPNPSTGLFSITENPLVKKIVVFNLLGRQVRSFEHTNGKRYDISGAPDGLYLVSMQDANGEVLKTVRITKQDLRP
ncbi:MAG: T9SS type A sorting domain-containing protein [Saprospiraceae bacterium]|nr:T9SS type A sorting domain-containing protein [Saprospiraceae bacterium]MCF8252512.1 T9SS type A sorting domain-containing protein [Saprospiraceae bacterium]MCF8282536.1 T9SS type A sorting domain-containing protein [Bacteroidales bacterium]MCF8314121.1 T9SS type A sorting domain-containing protein [Saprospiraceae bacterium]MCF8442866.1 T9SS type A sorting domain-containing protein [Saprospiraceae bacterium]